MPYAAKKPCTYPGCRELVNKGRCNKHQAVKKDKRLGSSARGYNYKWQVASKNYLRQHPLCVNHKAKGEIVAAKVVDHRTPHKGDMKLFWNPNNWQALCITCHNRKTATTDGAFGNAKG